MIYESMNDLAVFSAIVVLSSLLGGRHGYKTAKRRSEEVGSIFTVMLHMLAGTILGTCVAYIAVYSGVFQ